MQNYLYNKKSGYSFLYVNTPIVLHLLTQTVTPLPLDKCAVRDASQFIMNICANPSLDSKIIGVMDAGGKAMC